MKTPEVIKKLRQGDIEEMPFSDNSADVIVSNCVVNLVPNKEKIKGNVTDVSSPCC